MHLVTSSSILSFGKIMDFEILKYNKLTFLFVHEHKWSFPLLLSRYNLTVCVYCRYVVQDQQSQNLPQAGSIQILTQTFPRVWIQTAFSQHILKQEADLVAPSIRS